MKFYCIYEGIELKQHFLTLSKEIFRKSIHLCTAFVPLLLYWNKWITVGLLALVCILYTVFEILRLRGKNIPMVSAITAAAARKRDENKFVLGPVTLVLGIIGAAVFFDFKASCVGIFALAFGDGLASLSGKLFGLIHVPATGGKTVCGSLTCFSAILVTTFAVTKDIKTALICATTGMLIEVLPLKDFDNIVIPIILAFIVTVL